MIQALIRVIYL